MKRAKTQTADTKRIGELGLADHVLATLAEEGVATLSDWRQLGLRRLRIWGITRRTAAMLDRAAREARR